MRHDLLQGIDQQVTGWNPGSPENCQRCATQHSSWKRDRWPSAFPNLNEASLGHDDGKFLACYGSQKCFCGATPNVIDHDLKTCIAGLTQKRLTEFLGRRVEVNGRVRTEPM